MNTRPLLCVLAGFVLGEVWFYQFHGTAAKAVFSLIALILLIMGIRKKDSFFLLLLIGSLTGGLRENYWIIWQESFENCLYVDDSIIEGRIESEKISDTSISVVLDSLQINHREYKGKIQVYLEEDVTYYLGCMIRINGKIEAFAKPTNPGEFDYHKYQKGRGVWGCVYEADVLKVRYGSFLIKEGVYDFRLKTAHYLKNNLDESKYAVAAAMLLGEKSELEKEQKSLFEQGGISHILAVSGLHMTLIGAGIYKIFRKIGFPYGVCVFSSFPCILLYAMMTGMSSSCLRASIMLIIYLFAEWSGYIYDLPSGLSLAGMWLLWEIPDRIFDSGFLLSFGAMVGIGIVFPVLTEIFEYKTGIRRIKDGLFSGIVITLFTLPLSLHFFYGVSLAGLLLNIIVIPLMSFLVPLLGFGGIGWLALFPECVSRACLLAAGIMIDFYQVLCKVTEKISCAYIQTGYRGGGFLLIYYLVFVTMVTIMCHINKDRRKLLGLIWCVIMVLLIHFTGRNDSFLTVLDVGQGDGILFHSETGEVCMIDGGSTSKKNVGVYVIEPALKYYGISKVDYWFLSHMDEDHISGLKELLEIGYTIDYLILPNLKEKSEKQLEIEKLAYQNHTEILYMGRGESLQMNDDTIYCLHPKEKNSYEDENESSLVLFLRVKNQEFLLTGDVEESGENEMASYWKDFEGQYINKNGEIQKERILKVAHHGSAYGTSTEFLESFCPDIAVNSCGKNNSYGHPSAETVKRIMDSGAMFYNTAQIGAIEIRCGEAMQLYHYSLE